LSIPPEEQKKIDLKLVKSLRNIARHLDKRDPVRTILLSAAESIQKIYKKPR